jgi:hypothetical protein
MKVDEWGDMQGHDANNKFMKIRQLIHELKGEIRIQMC